MGFISQFIIHSEIHSYTCNNHACARDYACACASDYARACASVYFNRNINKLPQYALIFAHTHACMRAHTRHSHT